jgi:tagaturonate reductase
VAKPYALWAVQKQVGLVMPCQHPAIVLTDDLVRYERLKLFLINGSHTYLADRQVSSRKTA